MSEATLPAAVETAPEQIVIASHHPGRLCRPPTRSRAIENDRFRQTLLWNIFRTMELLPPAFWLCRLQTPLNLASLPAALGRVDLWRALTLPPTHLSRWSETRRRRRCHSRDRTRGVDRSKERLRLRSDWLRQPPFQRTRRQLTQVGRIWLRYCTIAKTLRS